MRIDEKNTIVDIKVFWIDLLRENMLVFGLLLMSNKESKEFKTYVILNKKIKKIF